MTSQNIEYRIQNIVRSIPLISLMSKLIFALLLSYYMNIEIKSNSIFMHDTSYTYMHSYNIKYNVEFLYNNKV